MVNRISDERAATILWMHGEGRSIMDIAVAVGRQPEAIRRWLKRNAGAEVRTAAKRIDPEVVRDLVGRGYNTTEIAEKLGFSREGVGAVRRRLGLQVSKTEGRKRLFSPGFEEWHTVAKKARDGEE